MGLPNLFPAAFLVFLARPARARFIAAHLVYFTHDGAGVGGQVAGWHSRFIRYIPTEPVRIFFGSLVLRSDFFCISLVPPTLLAPFDFGGLVKPQ